MSRVRWRSFSPHAGTAALGNSSALQGWRGDRRWKIGGIVGQAPLLGAQPAVFFRYVVVSVQAGDALPTALSKCVGEGGLGGGVSCAIAGEDGDGRNPSCEEFLRAALDPKHRSAPFDGKRRIVIRKALIRRQRQDQAAAFLEPVEPRVDRPGRAGVDVDDIARVE